MGDETILVTATDAEPHNRHERRARAKAGKRPVGVMPAVESPSGVEAPPAVGMAAAGPVTTITDPVADEVPTDPLAGSDPTAAVPADPAENSAEDSMDAINDTAAAAETLTENATAKTQAFLGDMGARSKDALEKGSKMLEEMGSFGKGNVEALVESSRIAAKGLETIGQDVADYSRRSFESATAVMKTLAQTRSPAEFMRLQGDYVRSALDAFVAETSRSTETMLKLAGDVAQPVANRVAMAADKVKLAA